MNQPPRAKKVPPIVKVSEMLREDAMADQARDAVVRARELMADKESNWFMGESTRKVLTELADEVEAGRRERERVRADVEKLMNSEFLCHRCGSQKK